MAATDSPFRGTDRFQVVRRLGAGGMGVVYEVIDHEREQRMALKTLHRLEAEALLRLKAEFHGLLDLQHPNLVRLGELHSAGAEQWFFTMELIDGVDLLEWVRPGEAHGEAATLPGGRALALGSGIDLAPVLPGGFDEARLRDTFRQLAEGLAALHASRKVHRDVKPSNVMVSRDGRAVLLDFGLATEFGAAPAHSDLNLVGTCDYMAPEQAAARPAGPAADWYSVGVVLYQALTGRLPFNGAPLQVVMDKQRLDAPSPRRHGPVPPDLALLCQQLLARDPAARPSGSDVLAALGVRRLAQATPVALSVSGTGATPFVGRSAETATLTGAFAAAASAPVCVLVTGVSGVGKSALVKRAIARMEAVVLAGRCYQHDAVPYRAVDGVIDALSEHLARLGREEVAALVPRRAGLLQTMFPVLGKVRALTGGEPPAHVPDPQELRLRVFAVLRELLARMAERRRLVLVIDDLHWADSDSLALLEELLRGPEAPPILLIATARESAWRPPCRRIDLAVAPLPREQAEELAQRLGARAGAHIDPARLAAEAGGHPLFIDELVRHLALRPTAAAGGLDDALWARIGTLGPEARDLLALIAVAGVPLPLRTIALAAELSPAQLAEAMGTLRVAHLARTSGARHDDTTEAYHDRVREAVLARLGAEERRRCHHRLALSIGITTHIDPEALAQHWHGAGDPARAARLYASAAQQAAQALAFDRAAELYAVALAVDAEAGGADTGASGVGGAGSAAEAEQRRWSSASLATRRTWSARRGDALASAGHGVAAAQAYRAAANGGLPGEAQELTRRAAEQLLRAGHIDSGLELVEQVLGVVGLELPRTPRRALLSLLLRRARVRLRGLGYRARPAAEVAPALLERIDTCWSVGLGLSIVDTIRGADFQSRNLLLALDAGEPYRICRALALEAGMAALAGGPGQARASRLVALAEALALELDDPHAQAMACGAAGIAAHMVGSWQAAHSACVRADRLLRDHCTGTAWERDSLQMFEISSLYALGRLGELRARVEALLADAHRRGDLYAVTNLGTGIANVAWLAADQPARARRETDAALAGWSQRGFHVQHWSDLVARGQIALYIGEPEEALAWLEQRWPALRASLLLRVQLMRHTLLDTRARLRVAAAARAVGPARARLLAAAAGDAAAILGDGMAWSRNLAEVTRAGVAHLRGDDAAARAALARAQLGFDADGAALFAAVTTLRRAQLDGDERARRDAHAAIAACGVADAACFAAMLAPGF